MESPGFSRRNCRASVKPARPPPIIATSCIFSAMCVSRAPGKSDIDGQARRARDWKIHSPVFAIGNDQQQIKKFYDKTPVQIDAGQRCRLLFRETLSRYADAKFGHR